MRGSEFEADGCKLVLKNPFWQDNTSIVCYFKLICQQSHTVFIRLNAASIKRRRWKQNYQ